MITAIKYFIRWIISLLSSINKRFIPFSPPFLSSQILFDKKAMNFIVFKIRNYVDWISLRQVYFNEDYRISQLKRANDIYKCYENIIKENEVPLIVDCGANIGLSAQYFSNEFKDSHVVAVEISYENVNQIQLNIKNKENISIKNNAIGSESILYDFIDPGLGANAFRAHPSSQNQGIQGITINDIIQEHSDKKPFIIKIDIEGGEYDLFSKNYDWIDKFPIIIIELHDWLLPNNANSYPFIKAISNYKRDFVICGENIYSISNSMNN